MTLPTNPSHLQCPWLVQFIGASVDMEMKQCAILSELMNRGSLHCVLHVDKIPLDWNTRIGIVSGWMCVFLFINHLCMCLFLDERCLLWNGVPSFSSDAAQKSYTTKHSNWRALRCKAV